MPCVLLAVYKELLESAYHLPATLKDLAVFGGNDTPKDNIIPTLSQDRDVYAPDNLRPSVNIRDLSVLFNSFYGWSLSSSFKAVVTINRFYLPGEMTHSMTLIL
ncbi:hypothetical protein RRG08_048459 [Elysia crispata]|uniref:Uncharacterized protein n=1 Tax=Elysia crispata TaxID=231223 RepID=A0AAE1ECG8_9GAST|nr:hypothetical protein RRG08_048459 [Elysia crispata]